MNDFTDPPAGKRKIDPAKWVISAHRFTLQQRRHFIVCNILPLLLTIAGAFLLPRDAFDWKGISLLALTWFLVGGLGISVGFHRHFAHRSFIAVTPLRYVLGVLGSMAAQGSVIYWTALHRRHHSFSDSPGDPHSPRASAHPTKNRLQAFLQGHFLWVIRHDVPMPSRYAKDLLADRVATRLTQHYSMLVALGVCLPALAGLFIWDGLPGALYGAYWGGIVRLALGHQIIWAINSVCHVYGYQPYDTNDNSRNNAWLAIISFGESWHNNHHHSAASAQFGKRWYELDIGWMFIRTAEMLRLARDAKK
jgi:stearoyl-CoA desaturase (delta-9 desaturase)